MSIQGDARYVQMLGRGVYTPAEASRLLGMRPATVRAWIKGNKSSSRAYDELDGGEVLLSFQDLIELWVVGQLRRRGMPLKRVRQFITRAAHVKQVLEDSDRVDFDDKGRAALFWPKGRSVPVVVDPHRCYGAPVIRGTRVPTALVHELLRAGDSVELIANSYGLRVEDVEAARDFMLQQTAFRTGRLAATRKVV